MRRLTTALGIAFLATLVGCGKTEGTKPTGTSAAAPSSAAQAKLPTTATVKGIGTGAASSRSKKHSARRQGLATCSATSTSGR